MLPGTASSDAVEQRGTGQPYHGTTEYRGVDIENWEYVQHVGVEIFRTEYVQ